MKPRTIIALILAGLAATSLHGCSSKAAPISRVTAVSDREEPPVFRDVAKEAGIDYRWVIPDKRPLTILPIMGNGCAFLDYDRDGNLDILLVGRKVALYKGDGMGRFKDVSQETGIAALTGDLRGCAVGDYDDDGFPDIYFSAYRGGRLVHNEGGKRFVDVTASSGLSAQPWGSSCEFADVDGDGRLDLYVGNYVDFGPDSKFQLCTFNGHRAACGPEVYTALHGTLFRNLGGGKFQDITKAWGADKVSGKCLGVAFADYDGSGRQSLALANDEMPADLLHNTGSRFTNDADKANVAVSRDGQLYGGMGIDWGDYDNDGRLDLIVTTFRFQDKVVFHNDGAFFSEKSASLGLADAVPYVGFGVKWLDYDNDGWLDLLVCNGHVQDNVAEVDASTSYRQPTLLLHNQGGSHFEHVSRLLSEEVRKPIVGRGLAIGDYDNDGRLDALIVDSEGTPLLLHNECRKPGNWIGFELEQPGKNRLAYGALVTIEAGGKKMIRQCQPGGSYLSSSDPRIHFGIGTAAKVDRVTVRWPDGKTDTRGNSTPGKYNKLTKR